MSGYLGSIGFVSDFRPPFSRDQVDALTMLAAKGLNQRACRPKKALAPRDAGLGVAGTSMSPGLAAMNDLAAAAGLFAGAARLLEELAGTRLTAKRVERAAEASGTVAAEAGRERAR